MNQSLRKWVGEPSFDMICYVRRVTRCSRRTSALGCTRCSPIGAKMIGNVRPISRVPAALMRLLLFSIRSVGRALNDRHRMKRSPLLRARWSEPNQRVRFMLKQTVGEARHFWS